MPWVLSNLPPELEKRLDEKIKAPCPEQDRRTYEKLKTQLRLNPKASFDDLKLQPTAADCTRPTSPREILLRGFVDDPDAGLDQDLPDTDDPRHERDWMGGKTGVTSQGFRHMYFGGWKLSRPIETFQIPLHAVGQAPERTQIMADAARNLFSAGEAAWGWRALAWEMHYVQDLAQPFHAVQMLSPRMIQWSSLARGPKTFISEGTRTVGNYHWAYEGLTFHELRLGSASPLADCLRASESHANVHPSPSDSEQELALEQAKASVSLGSQLGRELMPFFGSQLKNPGVDLARDQGTPDYEVLARSQLPAHQRIDAVSCAALSNAIRLSDELISRALAAAPK